MKTGTRIVMAGLALSAVGLSGIAQYEGYTDKAIQPVPGDVPTYGFGSTTRPDGRPVEMGDKITPPAALALVSRDVALKEGTLKKCFGDVSLTQGEYDAYVSLAYNVGPAAVCRSSIPGKLKAERYEDACRTILDFKRVQGRDCCLPENSRFCGGICTRRQKEYQTCMAGIIRSPLPLAGEGPGERAARFEDSSSLNFNLSLLYPLPYPSPTSGRGDATGDDHA